MLKQFKHLLESIAVSSAHSPIAFNSHSDNAATKTAGIEWHLLYSCGVTARRHDAEDLQSFHKAQQLLLSTDC